MLLKFLFFFRLWIKHVLRTGMNKKVMSEIGGRATTHFINPEDSIMQEEIQEQNRRNLSIATVMTKPSAYVITNVDNADEVGTCVETIVPEPHFPNEQSGKFSQWKIIPAATAVSSMSSSSASFGVLKKAYSAFSSAKKHRNDEEINWLDQDMIDDDLDNYD